ncbi:DUF475 domain-containing protein [Sulfurovum sp. bin170]|uniref:DUF475 domain-containing protein n=1 Tax=Sulfurovum sp. bin170 TaxID=2695268 RepID=UPI0013E00487|nr:DUF475 domain-containing protein [Sulfurovum sp. bin170]NEW60416.1 DUF475 domain-containing protein [Sulfurovum sp. bin170]
MSHFKYSFIFTALSLALISVWGFHTNGLTGIATALFFTSILIVMEVSLSFDNAVVNASILRDWDDYWKKIFLTIGIIVAVFGMRLLFPILIVAQTADMGMLDVWRLALDNPALYSEKLTEHHAEISAFGGMFLLLVFLNFLFDEEKSIHWFSSFEKIVSKLGKIEAVSTLVALYILLFVAGSDSTVLIAGIWGVIVYLSVHALGVILEYLNSRKNRAASNVAKGSIGGFIYLEMLDASFSFDGVIGSFAITNDIVIIMVGLGVGAMFVRSMTIYLVDKGTLDSYIYLEHGAHYAIGALALIMIFGSIGLHIPEIITGLIGVSFIIWAYYSSKKHKS